MAEKQYDWAAIAKNPKFVELHHKKQAFLFGWWIFSSAYYFLLPIGAAYAPGLFKIKIIGVINFGYVFALSQFFVAWFIAFLYVRAAARFDEQGRAVLEHLDRHNDNLKREQR